MSGAGLDGGKQGSTKMANEPPLLQVEDLTVSFRTQAGLVPAVRGIDFSLTPGEVLGIIGESGSGKSTTARAVMGLYSEQTAVTGGSIRFDGRELVGLDDSELREYRGKQISLVLQDSSRSLNPVMPVGRQITEVLRTHFVITRKEARAQAIDLLGLVRLPSPTERFDQFPHQLSGGMRQRAMIAMAIACNPRLLIADEPTTSLDVTTQARIMELLAALQRDRDMAMILITHDIALATRYTDRIAVMYAGRIVEDAISSSLLIEGCMPYTRALLDSSLSQLREPFTPLPVIGGYPPDMSSLPVGCAYRPRCSVAFEHCCVSPDLRPIGVRHHVACWRYQ